MKVVRSLRQAKKRHPDCKVVRRGKDVYVICKTNPRFKAKMYRSMKKRSKKK